MSKATPNVYVNNMFDEGKAGDNEDYEDCFSTEDQSEYEDVNPIPKRSSLKTNVNTAHNITQQTIQDNSRSPKKKVPWRLILLISCFLVTIVVSNVVTFITTKDKFWKKKTQLTPCTGFNCLNGGECEVLNGTFICLCKSDFSGQFCEERKPCLSNPRSHSASCTGYDNNYTCHCPIGTEGNRCQDEFYEAITSPGFPSTYNNSIYKTWNIDVGVGNTIRIKFTDFALEEGADYVKVWLLL
ncbi:unnamed protein product [Mytilus coruscus]|uniref:EGF-like domain-containing protein n=1 Tax=Mytilus coruscus TaxID=42192 RepID=A0A6J8BBZ0_MYTCO|nr:unnamed protein product [Mytilus coruscus]